MTAAHKLPTVAIAVLLVLSAVASPVFAGGDGGLDGVTDDTVDSGTDTVEETTEGTTDDTTDTVDETVDETTDTVDDTTDDTTDTVDSGTDDLSTTDSTTTSTSTSTTTSSGGTVDSSASVHDWRTVGSDATHDGVNPDTTGPRVTLGSQWFGGPPAVVGSPVVANDTVYAVNETGTVVALERNGSERWAVDVTTPALESPSVAASPTVDDATVYVVGNATDGGYVFARNDADGSADWSVTVGSSVAASPVAEDGVVYVGSAPSTLSTDPVGPLTALDATDGSRLWTNTNLDGEVAAAPAVTDSYVYAATVEGTLYRVHRSNGTVADSVGLTSSSVVAAPTVVNDTVYVAATDGTVYAAPVSDLSQTHASSSLGGGIVGSPVVADGSVYAASTTGEVARYDDSLTVLNSTTVDERVTASPSMAGGTLYVPTASTVRTLDPDLAPLDEIATPATASGAFTPSAGAGYLGTADGVFAVHQLCDGSALGADTVRVPTDCATIGSAVGAVASGGTVVVEPGTYAGNVTVSKPVTLRGEGATIDSDFSEEYGVVVAADDVVVEGFTVEEHLTAGILVGAVDDTLVRNVTTDHAAGNFVDVEVRPAGGRASNVTVVDSDLDALTDVAYLNAAEGGAISDVTVARSTLRSDATDAHVRAVADSGGSVTGVTVRDTSSLKGTAGEFAAHSGGARVADVLVQNVSLDATSRMLTGFSFLAAPQTGSATVENVTVADTTLDGPYRNATRVEAVTADSGPAVVDGVTVRNTSLAPSAMLSSTGLAVLTGGDATTSTPSVRNVTVTDSRFEVSTTGIELKRNDEVGSIGPVAVTDSVVVNNEVGLRVVDANADDVSLTNSTVAGNADFGVANNGTGLLDATYNDWGNVSGPFDAASPDTDAAAENPDGTGDAVTDGVAYRPWVSQPEAAIETNTTDTTVTVSDVVGFESVSTDGFGDVESTEWSFGDGATATGETASHSYDSTGTYTVTLTVTDSLGDTGSATIQIEVVEEESGGSTETETATATPTDTATPTPTPTPTPGETETPTPAPTATESSGGSTGGTSGSSSGGPTGSSSGGSTGGTAGGSTGGSSSGSAGGTSTTEPMPTPSPTSTALFTGGSVHSISFDSPVAGNVSATNLEGLPAEVGDLPGALLGAMRITVPPAYENTSATITFSVATETLEAQGVVPENVRLARYHDGWQQLDTRVVERTEDRVVFEARTPGFSVFAAVGQPTETPTPTATASPMETGSPTAPATDSPTGTPAPTDSPTETDVAKMAGGDDDGDGGLGSPSMLGLGGLLVAVVLVGLVRRRRGDDGDVEPTIRS